MDENEHKHEQIEYNLSNQNENERDYFLHSYVMQIHKQATVES